MAEDHKAILQRNHKYIIQNLYNIEGICDGLHEKEFIELGDKQSILAKRPAPHEQIRHLLSLLRRRGKKAFEAFIDILRQEGNDDLAEKLVGKPNPVLDKAAPAPQEPETKWPFNVDKGSQIKHCKDNDSKLQQQGIDIYNMTKEKYKGKVLLFKNMEKENKKIPSNVLQYIDDDCSQFSQILKKSNFKICSPQHKNKSKEKIFEVIKKQAEAQNKDDYDSFVILLISVGDDPYTFWTKDQQITPQELEQLLGECQALRSKPKMIFIQTYCQADWNELLKRGDQVDASKETEPTVECVHINEDDLFTACATSEKGEEPWMPGRWLGSWFIQAFVQVFKEHAHELSFLQIMKKVDDLLKDVCIEEGKKKKVASVRILTKCEKKELYFFPGIYHAP